ncbi:toprim domain-containing protein [Candidatus Pacearchaeota archaeon]|nr:toprim domain-containing protein [Candidatus Pacearchaeota archaeon]
MHDINQETAGRWSGIMCHFGFDNILSGKHQPCMLCPGGKDRFRYTNHNGLGGYICNKCGAGSGLDFVMKMKGWDFKEAVSQIRAVLGDCKHVERKTDKNIKKRLNDMWAASLSAKGTVVERYLTGRKLFLPQCNIRFNPKCYDPDSKKDYPAMIAMVHDRDGTPMTLHRTYLTENGEKAKIDSPKKVMPCEWTSGCAVQLYQIKVRTLGIAEGIETAIACCKKFGVPTWSAISAQNLENFAPPEFVRNLYIYADKDKSFTGEKAAYILANKLYDKLNVIVKIPADIGDFADFVKKSSSNRIGKTVSVEPED